ncbi:MAG: deoxyribodipyrimidine photolyase [Micavibrio aeruginosavorus]|uniref:Deoxyribodipyrimidine photo-lyase n=1 Tax=Micavibrio aeruginosavorus TaxID=349221 RepID=A0A2W4ZJW3_9BACT|nr:MAG: deoxyribodipyrimidine photolyase [Micavibrio aeruginosavorus]
MASSTPSPVIVWFRQDLRLADNPALTAAADTGAPILPVYVLDDENAKDWKMGGASRFWLHHSLKSLNDDLNGRLILLKGDAFVQIPALAKETGATDIYWNRCYEPWRIARDTLIKDALKDMDIGVESFNGSLLWEPWDVSKGDGTPYKVFTPFFKKGCLSAKSPREPLPRPKNMLFATYAKGIGLDRLSLLPSKPEPRWDRKMEDYWSIGEKGALKALHDFVDGGLRGYKEGRNYMAKDNVSRLSPRLHFGEISPNQAWYAVKHKNDSAHLGDDAATFHSELGWREFSYSLLYYSEDLARKSLQPRFEKFPWDRNPKALEAWQKGQTGYPVVDAAMREMWETGYMHNRARMIVGSFLVKHLLLYWHEGEEWFWDCLVDADLANNAASWQWIAGCGADAAPYFRIFNPVTQGEKFDPDGAYVRRFVPELKNMPDKYLNNPWEAPEHVLRQAGVVLGKTYPKPVVDHAAARERALAAFAKTK